MTKAETFYQGATAAESGEEGTQLIKKKKIVTNL